MRVLLAILAAVNLETGVWAVADPGGWFRTYPGFGRHWLTVQGPFNEHLAVDAGAGFLAVGTALAVAAVWMRRSAVVVALIVLLAHAVPHFAFHVSHPVRGLSVVDTVVGVWGIALEALVGVTLLIWVRRGLPSGAG